MFKPKRKRGAREMRNGGTMGLPYNNSERLEIIMRCMSSFISKNERNDDIKACHIDYIRGEMPLDIYLDICERIFLEWEPEAYGSYEVNEINSYLLLIRELRREDNELVIKARQDFRRVLSDRRHRVKS
jgi:hypothetical protein